MEQVRLAPSVNASPDLSFELPVWHYDAACLNADPAMFFPEMGESSEPAKALCRRCPVRDECLTDALAFEAEDATATVGVRGGLSPNERHRLRRERSAA